MKFEPVKKIGKIAYPIAVAATVAASCMGLAACSESELEGSVTTCEPQSAPSSYEEDVAIIGETAEYTPELGDNEYSSDCPTDFDGESSDSSTSSDLYD